MKSKSELSAIILSTVTSLLVGGAFAADMPNPGPSSGTERCFGVAKKGQNACATAKHGCAGVSTKDRDPNEWSEVVAGSCLKQGGNLEPASK